MDKVIELGSDVVENDTIVVTDLFQAQHVIRDIIVFIVGVVPHVEVQRVGLAVDVVVGEDIEMLIVVVVVAKVVVDAAQSADESLAVDLDTFY